jgi:hypothetical protein
MGYVLGVMSVLPITHNPLPITFFYCSHSCTNPVKREVRECKIYWPKADGPLAQNVECRIGLDHNEF